MIKYFGLIISAGFFSSIPSAFSQDSYASLEKNVNLYAAELSHELNAAKDTLLLQSPKKITYIYSINEDYKRERDTYAGSNDVKVPLTNLSRGKHVFVVTEDKKRIIFVIRKHGETPSIKKVNQIEIASAGTN